MNPGNGRFGTVVLAAALLGIACLLGAAAGEHAEQVSAQGSTVAVVDPIEVFDALNESKELLAGFRTRGEEMSKKLDDAKVRESALKADFEAAAKDDPLRREKELAWLRAKFANEAEGRLQQELMDLEGADIRRKLYHKVVQTVETIATRNRIDLVLNDDRKLPPYPGGPDDRVVLSIRQGRKVLYGAGTIDITKQVIDQMNNDFAAKRN